MNPFTYEDSLNEALGDPAFRAIWDANETKREITKAVIRERVKRNLSQEALARKVGLKRPSLARIESGSEMPSLTTLDKIAKGLGMKLQVKFV